MCCEAQRAGNFRRSAGSTSCHRIAPVRQGCRHIPDTQFRAQRCSALHREDLPTVRGRIELEGSLRLGATRRRYPRPLLAPGRPKLLQLMRARSSMSSNRVIRKKAAINCRLSFIRLTQPRSPLAGGGGGGGGTGQAAVARITVPSTQVCVAGASTTGGIGGGTYAAGFGCFQPRSSFAPMRK